jgi:hypothetical protein
VLVPLALLASAGEHSKLAKRFGQRWAKTAALSRWVAMIGVVVFFAGCTITYSVGLHDVNYQASTGTALVNDIAIPLQETLSNFYGGTVLLFIVAALAVVRFSYGIGQIVHGVVRRAPIKWTRWGLVALIAAETFFILRRYPGSGWLSLKQYPQIVVLSALSIGLFAWMTLAARGLFGTSRREVETEQGEHFVSLPYTVYHSDPFDPVSGIVAFYSLPDGPEVYRTTNGGQSFEERGVVPVKPIGPADISFSNAEDGLALVLPMEGEAGEVATLWRTTNGGSSWQSVKAPAVGG